MQHSMAVTRDVCVASSDSVSITFSVFFFNATATTEIYTLSLHDALPICHEHVQDDQVGELPGDHPVLPVELDRKSTRLNSSHVSISYAVFCLKKKKLSIILCITDIKMILQFRFL